MTDKFHYVFGPVPSRRLGYSLGVDVVPMKTCDLNCVYCELGRTTRETLTRKAYVTAEAVVPEIEHALQLFERIDFITFTGSGEPTLNTDLGRMIQQVKAITSIPVAVLTNGTLLYLPEVRKDVALADVVIPSLDAASPQAFRRVNRPHGRLDIETIIEGLKQFRREYRGQIWLEILFVRGFNDDPQEVDRLVAAARAIQPDRIQLNTVVRPPAESGIQPISETELEAIRQRFGARAEIIARFQPRDVQPVRQADEDMVLSLIARRPVTMEDITASLGMPSDTIEKVLHHLLATGKATVREHQGQRFYFASPRYREEFRSSES